MSSPGAVASALGAIRRLESDAASSLLGANQRAVNPSEWLLCGNLGKLRSLLRPLAVRIVKVLPFFLSDTTVMADNLCDTSDGGTSDYPSAGS